VNDEYCCKAHQYREQHIRQKHVRSDENKERQKQNFIIKLIKKLERMKKK
jgi:hypothetical protein